MKNIVNSQMLLTLLINQAKSRVPVNVVINKKRYGYKIKFNIPVFQSGCENRVVKKRLTEVIRKRQKGKNIWLLKIFFCFLNKFINSVIKKTTSAARANNPIVKS